MRIQEIHVKNFRSILEASLSCDYLTALVGRNGSGKSSFLNALEIFYDPLPNITEEDFYSNDVSQNIEIAVTFTDFNDEEKDDFAGYINSDTNRLVVTRSLSFPLPTKTKLPHTYYGTCLQNNDFVCVREASNAAERKNKYNEIRKKEKYASLPPVSSKVQIYKELTQWECCHPKQCSPMLDDGQFFGFTQDMPCNLAKYTRFIRVPAVRDAQDDATEKKGSCITDIMDLAVRNILASREDVESFKHKTQAQYKEILDADNLEELQSLEDNLSTTLRVYAPNATVLLQWSRFADIEIPMPQAQIKLEEDGYKSAVQRTGHGLQRAFILTMLQHLLRCLSV